MMYLLTMGWFLAHTSLAMTPEQIKGFKTRAMHRRSILNLGLLSK